MIRLILIRVAIILLAVVLTIASPFVVIYASERPLNPDRPNEETFTEFRSGFPLPYLHRNNLSVGMGLDWWLFGADVVLWSAALLWLAERRARTALR